MGVEVVGGGGGRGGPGVQFAPFIRAHNVDFDGFLSQGVVVAFEPGFEPVEAFAQAVGGVAGVEVVPGAEGEVGGLAGGAEGGVVFEQAAEGHVVPAAEEEGGGADVGEGGAEVEGVPVGVGGVGVGEAVAVVGEGEAGEGFVGLRERGLEGLGEEAVLLRRVEGDAFAGGVFVHQGTDAREDHDPAQADFDIGDAVGVGEFVHFRGHHGGHDGFEGGGGFGGDGPLGVGEVALAPHAEVAVEPGLVFDPGDGVEAVFGFVEDGFKGAFGVELAARGLDEDVVAAFGEAGVGVAEGEAHEAEFGAAPVDGADEEGGEGAAALPLFGAGGVVVGFEDDTVPHGDGEVAFDGDFVAGRGEVEPAGDEPGAGLVEAYAGEGGEEAEEEGGSAVGHRGKGGKV